MGSRTARIVAGIIVAGSSLVLGIALAGESPDTNRADALASRLRCVDCDHGSIADSPSVADREMRRLISARIAAGESDAAIVADFVAGYGEVAFLSPRSGAGVALWVVPGLVLIGGLVATLRLLRRQGAAGATADAATAARDHADLEKELAAGDIAAADAVRLRTIYRTEAEQALPAGRLARPPWPLLLVAAGLAIGIAALAARGPAGAAADPVEFEGVAAYVVANGAPDLAGMTATELAAVVARNPDVVPLRLSLSRLYRAAGDLDAARAELTAIIDRHGPVPEALAEAGWIVYLQGDAVAAAALIEGALVVDPTFSPARWYLGNVLFYGLDDANGASAALRDLLLAPDLPDDIRQAATELLAIVTEARE